LPFDFRYLKCISSVKELDDLVGPTVVLASFPDMDFGFSRELLIKWGTDAQNTIILPDRCGPGTMGRRLFDYWNANSPTDLAVRPPIFVDLDVPMEVKISKCR
jgi:cleavage and polyadenylation specificity factor subunit 2